MSDNYQEEIPLLRKLLRTESFRFVIITYNHYSLVTRLKKEITSLFPDRNTATTNAEKVDFSQLFRTYKDLESGILFVDNFEDIIKLRTDSLGEETPEIAKDNARRRGITAGLNLRRDKLSKYPIALIVFISSATQELYMRTLMERMPDLWSFRSLVLELELEKEVGVAAAREVVTQLPLENIVESPTETAEAEIRRLEKLLQDIPLEEVAYRSTVYRQLTDRLSEVGYYDRAIIYLEEWLEVADEEDKGTIFYKIGRTSQMKGDLHKALSSFEKFHDFHEKRLLINEKSPFYKNSMAVSYERLGDIYRKLGDLGKALSFFEKRSKIVKELFESYPANHSYKQGLAVSYSKLGDIYYALGNTEKAMLFFKDSKILTKELYDNYPDNERYKQGLAISYSKIGEVYSNFGELEKAVLFFEKEIALFKELNEISSNKVNYKHGLGISFEKLGDIYYKLGDLDRAQKFFNQRLALGVELHDSYPKNVSFKNGLAVSYCKLAQINEIEDKFSPAISLYKKAEQLWSELTKVAPDDDIFQKYLEKVRKDLNRLQS